MSRERLTGKKSELTAAIELLAKAVSAVDDSGLTSEADKSSAEDMQAVNKSRPAGPADLQDQGDQNAKANANWPVSEADKKKVAAKLLKLAKALLEG